MAKLSKTDAAKTINVSRSTLYNHIKKGRVSADPDGMIDTAELIRAGFELHIDAVQPDDDIVRLRTENERLSNSVQVLHEELSETKAEKARLWNVLEEAQRQHRLFLDVVPQHRSGFRNKLRSWWRGTAPS